MILKVIASPSLETPMKEAESRQGKIQINKNVTTRFKFTSSCITIKIVYTLFYTKIWTCRIFVQSGCLVCLLLINNSNNTSMIQSSAWSYLSVINRGFFSIAMWQWKKDESLQVKVLHNYQKPKIGLTRSIISIDYLEKRKPLNGEYPEQNITKIEKQCLDIARIW